MIGSRSRLGGFGISCLALGAIAGLVGSWSGSGPAVAQAQVSTSTQPASSTPPPELAQAKALSRAFQWAAGHIDPSVVHIAQINRIPVRASFRDMGQMQRAQTGVGSGVIVSRDGYILTNNHVVEGAEELLVKLADGNEVQARIIGTDPSTDLAVVKVEASELVPAEWGDSETLEVGEWVVAVGSPFGLDNTVTSGIVSAKGRFDIGVDQPQRRWGQRRPEMAPGDNEILRAPRFNQDFIQTDAAINPGNSGGPLITLEGKLVGINSAIATRSGGSDGIGFAIPAAIARPVMETLIQYGQVRRGWLGVVFEPRPGGIAVNQVVPNSPASRSDFKNGDVVVSFQGRPVLNLNRLRNAIALTPPGTPVDFQVRRDGEVHTLRVSLEDLERGESIARGGVEIEALKCFARTVDVGDIQGAQILQFLPGSKASEAQRLATPRDGQAQGLQPDDVVVAVTIGRSPRSDTPNVPALEEALRSAKSGDQVRFFALRPMGRGNFVEGYIDTTIE